jgi:O-antigen ligase
MNRLFDLPHANRRAYALWVGLAVALGATALGALLGFAGPLITAGIVLGLALGVWALSSLEVGVCAVVAVITLLPFGGLPFKIVFTPTFLDLALLAAAAVYALQWMSGKRWRLATTPAHPLIAAFMALATFSFVAGLPNGPLTSNLIRQFAEMLLSILFAFILVDYVERREILERVTRVILVGGVLAAALGIALYLLPDSTAERALSSLRVFNYPSGSVLRYIEDNPENPERAIATSIDPNALGGLLAMIGALLAPQLLARRPLLGSRVLTIIAFGVVVTCLVLTFSRGAMAALAVGLLVIGLARYRRMILVLVLVGLVIAILPATQEYVTRFVEGAQGQDLATQMRFGEYKDAFILIQRHPLGVGFSGAPENDIYLGVSSAYLLMASNMGLTGLALFLVVMAAVFGWAYARRKAVYADGQLTPVWLGLLAGVAAALTVGVVDHYFFNPDFQAAGAMFWAYVGLSLAATRLAAE